jgi:hypothetical protein
MAEPTAYNVSYSFSGWQATNPSLPLPAAQVDIEFANIEASLDSVVTALADVRRSDGLLQNGLVGLDQLDEQVTELMGGYPRVLVSDLSPAVFATQESAEAGVASDKLMTPLRSAQATEAQRPYALQAAAQAGTEAVGVMSPLRTSDAITALRPFASEGEAEAGANNTKVLTPLRAAQEIQALRMVFTAEASITWGGILTLAGSTQAVNVPGAEVGDRVTLGLPAAVTNDGLHFKAWVSAADTVSIRAYNSTGSTITPTAAQSYTVTAQRF